MVRVNQSTARVRATLNAPMWAFAGPAIIILLLLANLAYVAFGGTLKASPAPEPETSISAAAVEPADGGGAPRNEKVSDSSAEPTNVLAGRIRQSGP